jgi:hypothetical protein
MRTVAIVLLMLLTLVTGLAQAYDRHSEAGCADAASSAFPDSDSTTDPDRPSLQHASGCCFGSLVLAQCTQLQVSCLTVMSVLAHPEDVRPPGWQSEGPERPPRS